MLPSLKLGEILNDIVSCDAIPYALPNLMGHEMILVTFGEMLPNYLRTLGSSEGSLNLMLQGFLEASRIIKEEQDSFQTFRDSIFGSCHDIVARLMERSQASVGTTEPLPGPIKRILETKDPTVGEISEIPKLYKIMVVHDYLKCIASKEHLQIRHHDLDRERRTSSQQVMEIWGSSITNACRAFKCHRNNGSQQVTLPKSNFLELSGSLKTIRNCWKSGLTLGREVLDFIKFVLRIDGLAQSNTDLHWVPNEPEPPLVSLGSNLYFMRVPLNKEKLKCSLMSGKNSILPLVSSKSFASRINAEFASFSSRGRAFSRWDLKRGLPFDKDCPELLANLSWFFLSAESPMEGLLEDPNLESLEKSGWIKRKYAQSHVLSLKKSAGLTDENLWRFSQLHKKPKAHPFDDWFQVVGLGDSESLLVVRKDMWPMWVSTWIPHRTHKIPIYETLMKFWKLPPVGCRLVGNVMKYNVLRQMLSWLTCLQETKTLQFMLSPDHVDFEKYYGSIFVELDMWNTSTVALNDSLHFSYANPTSDSILKGLVTKILVKKKRTLDRSVADDLYNFVSGLKWPLGDVPSPDHLQVLNSRHPHLLHLLEHIKTKVDARSREIDYVRLAERSNCDLLKLSSEIVGFSAGKEHVGALKRKWSNAFGTAKLQPVNESRSIARNDPTAFLGRAELIRDDALGTRHVCIDLYGADLFLVSQAKRRRKCLHEGDALEETVLDNWKSKKKVSDFAHIMQDLGCNLEMQIEREKSRWNAALKKELKRMKAEDLEGSTFYTLLKDIKKPLLWQTSNMFNHDSDLASAGKNVFLDDNGSQPFFLLLGGYMAAKILDEALRSSLIPIDIRQRLYLSSSLLDETSFEGKKSMNMHSRYVIAEKGDSQEIVEAMNQGKDPSELCSLLHKTKELGSLSCGKNAKLLDIVENFDPPPFKPAVACTRNGKKYLKHIDSRRNATLREVDRLLGMVGKKIAQSQTKKNVDKRHAEYRLSISSGWFWRDSLLYGSEVWKQQTIQTLQTEEEESTVPETMKLVLAFIEYAFQCDYFAVVNGAPDGKYKVRNVLEALLPPEPYYNCFKSLTASVVETRPKRVRKEVHEKNRPSLPLTSAGACASPAYQGCIRDFVVSAKPVGTFFIPLCRPLTATPTTSLLSTSTHKPPTSHACQATSKPSALPLITNFSSNPNSTKVRKNNGSWASNIPNLTSRAPALPRKDALEQDDTDFVIFQGDLEVTRHKLIKKLLKSCNDCLFQSPDASHQLDLGELEYLSNDKGLVLDWYFSCYMAPGFGMLNGKPIKVMNRVGIERKTKPKKKTSGRTVHDERQPAQPARDHQTLSGVPPPTEDDLLILEEFLAGLDMVSREVGSEKYWKMYDKNIDKPGMKNYFDPEKNILWLTRYQTTG